MGYRTERQEATPGGVTHPRQCHPSSSSQTQGDCGGSGSRSCPHLGQGLGFHSHSQPRPQSKSLRHPQAPTGRVWPLKAQGGSSEQMWDLGRTATILAANSRLHNQWFLLMKASAKFTAQLYYRENSEACFEDNLVYEKL